ncbi:hypothetical protein CKAH01_17607 [Colletotrichum kahawae]|uniref:Uncharacterized protein n=1 Tax=Colletotrichum kahawae TaxID=34407 RepID=A0AAE0D3E0_COLKA|nr:hypothetical protein CKAH01_17607 [Colletotrichum kahawae]
MPSAFTSDEIWGYSAWGNKAGKSSLPGTADRVIIGLEALRSVLLWTMAARVITEVGDNLLAAFVFGQEWEDHFRRGSGRFRSPTRIQKTSDSQSLEQLGISALLKGTLRGRPEDGFFRAEQRVDDQTTDGSPMDWRDGAG